jgi:hypothetical protein
MRNKRRKRYDTYDSREKTVNITKKMKAQIFNIMFADETYREKSDMNENKNRLVSLYYIIYATQEYYKGFCNIVLFRKWHIKVTESTSKGFLHQFKSIFGQ